MKYILAIIILIFTTALITQAQVTDSAKPRTAQIDSTVASTPVADEDVENDFEPGLLLLVLAFVGILAVAIVFGLVMTAITLTGIFAMISFGILSASIMAGIYSRSVTKGFKVFFILFSLVIGGALGCTLMYTLNFFTQWYNVEDSILMGSAFGLVAGLAGGMITFYFLQRLVAWLRTKITIQTIPK